MLSFLGLAILGTLALALEPTNPIIFYGTSFEVSVTNAWSKVFGVNVYRERFFVQNNSAGDITISKNGRGVAGQGIVVKANGGYYSESGERDPLTGRMLGVHQGEWYIIASAAGPFAIEIGET